MKKNVIKKHLSQRLTWNYSYYNVVDANGIIIESFDLLIDAKLFVDQNKQYYIQKCHNISYLL